MLHSRMPSFLHMPAGLHTCVHTYLRSCLHAYGGALPAPAGLTAAMVTNNAEPELDSLDCGQSPDGQGLVQPSERGAWGDYSVPLHEDRTSGPE